VVAAVVQHEGVPGVWTLLAWAGTHFVVNFFALGTKAGIPFVPDFPLAVGQAFILTPVAAGIVTTLGAIRLEEVRTSVSKSLLNQSQAGLFAFLGSLAAHQLPSSVIEGPWILIAAFLPLAVQVLASAAFVSTAVSIERHISFAKSVSHLRVGATTDLAYAFGAWGLLGAILVVLYGALGPWALGAFVFPIFLSGQLLARSQALLDARDAFAQREEVLKQLMRRMEEERADERRMVAADLHDEVLPPIFQVALLAEVVKLDLARGRLLDIDEDSARLALAAEETARTLRTLIGNLRKAPIGLGNLRQSIENLVQRMQTETRTVVTCQLEAVRLSPSSQLVIYQICKEALTNAIGHSLAKSIELSLRREKEEVVLEIHDNGIGFNSELSPEGHYGMKIMQERAQALGAQLFIDSAPGEGCLVRLVVPLTEIKVPRRRNL
jgi:signal transduction histidine kinase